jgi:hypothetical protein
LWSRSPHPRCSPPPPPPVADTGRDSPIVYDSGWLRAELQKIQSATLCPPGEAGASILEFGAAAGKESGANIQNALNKVGSVYVPDGTFFTRTKIHLNDNNTLRGPGKIVATKAVDAVLQAVGKTNVHVSDIAIEGTPGSLPLGLIQYKSCAASSIRCTRLRYATHEGISFNQSTHDSEAVGNLIRDISGSIGWGIGFFWDIKSCKAISNTIRDCGAYGILLDDGTTGQTDNLPCVKNLISGNIIETSTTGMWGIGIEGSSENEITMNAIDVISTYGIDIAIGNSRRVFAPTNNTVADNSIRARTGVRLAGSYNRLTGGTIDGKDSGVVCDQSVTLSSVGNEIDGVTITGQATGNRRAIQCSNANFKDLKIRRNKLLSATAQWSVLVDAGTGATVEDNDASAPYMVRGAGHSFNRNKLKGKLVRAAL